MGAVGASSDARHPRARERLEAMLLGGAIGDALGAPLEFLDLRQIHALTGPEGPDRSVGSVIKRPAVVIFPDSTLRDAADQMVRTQVGRLAVVERSDHRRLVGILSRSDLIAAHARRLEHQELE